MVSQLSERRWHILRASLIITLLLSLIPVFYLVDVLRYIDQSVFSTNSSLLKSSKYPLTSINSTTQKGDFCVSVGLNKPQPKRTWHFNSRALCATSNVCFPLRTGQWLQQSADPLKTRCQFVKPNFETIGSSNHFKYFGGCDKFRHKTVSCAYGTGLERNRAKCTKEIPFNPDKYAKWIDDLSLIVPDYPYPSYIYHFANVASSIAYFVDHLDTVLMQYDGQPAGKTLNIIFLSSRNTYLWQSHLLDVLIRRRIKNRFEKLHIHYIPEMSSFFHSSLCARRAVMLGKRGHVNVWPFPNTTSISFKGDVVPKDAVNFKRVFYDEYKLQNRLPSGPVGITDLPPLVLGYSRRLGPESVGGNVHGVSAVRRFAPADEEWFQQMLREETSAAGFGLKIFTTRKEESLRQQVNNIQQIGFIVGIHGANLLNSIFMRPFGAMLEIFPNGASSSCYWAGSNSGLMYMDHFSSERASPEESGCLPEHFQCWDEPLFLRQRLVKLGSKKDREGARLRVRHGMKYLLRLHQQFPNGIPVRYQPSSGNYKIDRQLVN